MSSEKQRMLSEINRLQQQVWMQSQGPPASNVGNYPQQLNYPPQISNYPPQINYPPPVSDYTPQINYHQNYSTAPLQYRNYHGYTSYQPSRPPPQPQPPLPPPPPPSAPKITSTYCPPYMAASNSIPTSETVDNAQLFSMNFNLKQKSKADQYSKSKEQLLPGLHATTRSKKINVLLGLIYSNYGKNKRMMSFKTFIEDTIQHEDSTDFCLKGGTCGYCKESKTHVLYYKQTDDHKYSANPKLKPNLSCFFRDNPVIHSKVWVTVRYEMAMNNLNFNQLIQKYRNALNNKNITSTEKDLSSNTKKSNIQTSNDAQLSHEQIIGLFQSQILGLQPSQYISIDEIKQRLSQTNGPKKKVLTLPSLINHNSNPSKDTVAIAPIPAEFLAQLSVNSLRNNHQKNTHTYASTIINKLDVNPNGTLANITVNKPNDNTYFESSPERKKQKMGAHAKFDLTMLQRKLQMNKDKAADDKKNKKKRNSRKSKQTNSKETLTIQIKEAFKTKHKIATREQLEELNVPDLREMVKQIFPKYFHGFTGVSRAKKADLINTLTKIHLNKGLYKSADWYNVADTMEIDQTEEITSDSSSIIGFP
eukprot:194639_1